MSEHAYHPPQAQTPGLIHLVLAVAGVGAFVFFGVRILLPFVYGLGLSDDALDVIDLMILPIASILGVIVFVVLLGRLPWSGLGLRAAPAGAYLRALGWWLLCLPVVAAVLYATYKITGRAAIEEQLDMMPDLSGDDGTITAAFILLVGILSPIAEELVFRGVLFAWLRRYVNFWIAGLASALVFALAHGIPDIILPTAILGLLFAWIYERTGSLWPAMLAHVAHNLLVTGVMLPTMRGMEMLA
ncbi:MAG: lysostaphin resistance A-like protein [Alphaproteobacteria bacterium]